MKMIKRNEVLPGLPTFFDDFFGRDFFNNNLEYHRTSTTPAVNIAENENDFNIEVAAPGYKKGDFKVELNNDVLSISSERKSESTGDYARKEFHYESFSRSFRLPENVVDGDKIKAKYENGVLYLTLPKREEVKPKPVKQIEIK